MVLQITYEGYFTSRIFVVVLRMTKEMGVENFCYAGMQLHIFFALCATVLPGRMIRRGMVALKREMDSKKTFIRYISHEIRSPLSTTSLGLDYLIAQLSGQQNGGKRIEMSFADILDVLKDTKATCELATNTLNDLLMFDKIETGMLELATTEVDAWEFVNDCVKPFNLQATTSGIDMKCNYLGLNCNSAHGSESGSDLGWGVSRSMSNRSNSRFPVVDIEAQIGTQISGSYSDNGSCSNVSVRDQFELVINVDKYKMDQVVRNFLTNALKFTPQHSTGNISIDVSVQDAFSSVEPKGKKYRKKKTSIGDRYTISDRKKVLRVTVTDNGPGISKENLPKLFGQYVQFDANTLQGGKGSGLGLWLSKAIVEMHGGVIGATSPGVGLGCSFFLEIPCTLTQHHKAHNGDGRIAVSPDALNSPTIPRFNRPRVVTDLSSNVQNRNTGTEDNLSMQIHEARTPTVHFQRPRDMVSRHTNSNMNSHTNSDISKEPDSSERTANNHSLTITNTAPLNTKFRPELTTQLPLADEEAIEEIFVHNSAEKSTSNKSTKKTISIRVVGNEAARRESATASVGTMSQKYQQLIENAEDASAGDELKASLQQQTEQQSVNASEKHLPRPSHVTTMRHNRVKDSSKNQEPSKRHVPTVNGSNYPLTGLRVLLVDDSSIARKMVERMLSAVGCVCDHACNGQEAVHIVADQIAVSRCSYDVILIDCYMPVMNGPEAVKILRDRGFKGHILAVTGASTDGEFAPLLAEGLVERIVIKPFNAENFRQIVHELNRDSSK